MGRGKFFSRLVQIRISTAILAENHISLTQISSSILVSWKFIFRVYYGLDVQLKNPNRASHKYPFERYVRKY